MINEKVGEAKRQWLIDAPKLRDKMQKQIEAYLANIPSDIITLKSKIKEMMDLGEYQNQARAFFRDLNEITDEDLRTLYKDFVILMNLQKDEIGRASCRERV